MLLLWLLLAMPMKSAASDVSNLRVQSEKYSVLNGICIAESNQSQASGSKGAIGCAADCAKSDGCLACAGNESGIYRKLPLTAGSLAAAVSTGECRLVLRNAKIEEALTIATCPTNQTSQAAFLVRLNDTEVTGSNLGEFLCNQSCHQLSADGTLFASIGSAVSVPLGRCAPLAASAYFGGVGPSSSLLAVSIGWHQVFTGEAWCTHHDVTNVPPLILATWSQPHQLDVCAQACLWRSECEFFVFNATGCYEGSLSLYLNSRLIGTIGCSIQHKVRSWASSMLAYYTFNSSMLNLANPAVMSAVNNTPVDIGPDGFLVPQGLAEYVRLNLSNIGFDSLVRASTPFTFVMSLTRTVLKTRSEFALFASCSNTANYNGAINEHENLNRNDGWFLNSLTGEWQVAKSTPEHYTGNYSGSSVIHIALAIGTSSGYFIINGHKVPTNFYTAGSSYGTDPDSIGCLYLGCNYFNNCLSGRIKVIGIFNKMLTVSEVIELA